MMCAMTMQPSRDIPLVYPACPSCGRALSFAWTIPAANGLAELQTLNCRANAASGSRNPPTSIPARKLVTALHTGLSPNSPERSCPLALGVFSFGAPLSLPFGNYQNSFICLPDLFFVCLILDIKMMMDFKHPFEIGVGGRK